MAVSTIKGTKAIKPTFNSSLFQGYNGSEGNEPYLYERDGIIIISGIVSPKSQLTNADDQLICNIPSEYRPRREVHTIQQGSGSNRWDCVVKTSGAVNLQRYSNTTSNQVVPAGAYLPFCVTYIR